MGDADYFVEWPELPNEAQSEAGAFRKLDGFVEDVFDLVGICVGLNDAAMVDVGTVRNVGVLSTIDIFNGYRYRKIWFHIAHLKGVHLFVWNFPAAVYDWLCIIYSVLVLRRN